MLQFRNISRHIPEFMILRMIPFRRTMHDTLLYVMGNEKRRTFAQMLVELCQEYMDSCKVKIAKVDIRIRNGQQPPAQVGRLRIARDKKQALPRQYRSKQSALPANESKIFHVFHVDDRDVLRQNKRLPICNKQERALMRMYLEILSIQPARYRLK